MLHDSGQVFEIAPETIDLFRGAIDQDGFLHREIALLDGLFGRGNGFFRRVDSQALVDETAPQGSAKYQVASGQYEQVPQHGRRWPLKSSARAWPRSP
jgi:hypothetical protein